MNAVAVTKVSEIERIRALPEREPYDTDRQADGRYAAETERLIDEVTRRFARRRLTCACRGRRVEITGQRVLIYHEAEAGDEFPPLPVEMSFSEFAADDPEAAKEVREAKNPIVELKGLGHPRCLTRLNVPQAWALFEMSEGGIGLMTVGSGKTILSILAALAFATKTAVLLAKPDQRIHYKRAYEQLRQHFKVPTMVFEGSTGYIVPGTPALHFVPYSLLSNAKSTALLESLQPDLIICDEAHSLSAKTSSRTMRWLRYLTAHLDVKVCAWSGSLVNKSIKDAAHIFAHALGLKSPYPIKSDDVDAWSAVIDPSPVPDTTSTTSHDLRRVFGNGKVLRGGIEELFHGSDDVRLGFRSKVDRTPGVVSTRGSAATCSISIRERKAPPIPKAVLEALATVRQRWVRPDGEELAEAVEQARTAREVACGFYYHFVFRDEPDELIQEWFDKRKEWNRELRKKLLAGEVHLDSPLLCANAAERAWQEPRYVGDLPVWPAQNWLPWAAIKDKVEPISKAAWLDDFLAVDAADWAKKNRGIVWCQSGAFGRRIAQLAGLPYHGGGPGAEAAILAEDGSRSIIASLKAHSEGRDGLQHRFHKMLVAETPSSGKGWEQMLGRLVRIGQTSDEVEVELYAHVYEMKEAFRKAYEYAEFVQATTPNRQMMLAADIGEGLL